MAFSSAFSISDTSKSKNSESLSIVFSIMDRLPLLALASNFFEIDFLCESRVRLNAGIEESKRFVD